LPFKENKERQAEKGKCLGSERKDKEKKLCNVVRHAML
jgi:hypothetical protein